MTTRIPSKRRLKQTEPKKTRIPKSRKSLRNALLHLLEAKSFDQITIRDIAAAADVGYTTYFRHYPSKEALLDDVAMDEIARLSALTIPVYDVGDSRAACLTLCTYVHEHRRAWAALLTGGAAGIVRKELLRRGLKDSADRIVAHSALPHDLAVRLGISAMVEVLAWWLQQAKPMPVAKVADIVVRIAIGPLEAEAAALPLGDEPPPARRRRRPNPDRA